MKRSAEDAELEDSSEKRQKLSQDHLSRLSDELVLRVLSFLPPAAICTCQRLSHKFDRLANDSAIWRKQYFDRFVRPRASRLPGLKTTLSTRYTERPHKWLDEQHLVRDNTNWKQQYRLRHNWSQGSCDVNEITVAEQPHIPPMVVQMHEGIIYTADMTHGLRAWPAKGKRELLAQAAFAVKSPPTAMAIGDHDGVFITVGFENGSFDVLRMRKTLTRLHSVTSEDGVLASVAMSWPFLVTMSATHRLSLYKLDKPRLLHSLKAHNVWNPLSVSLRAADEIVISVAYALPTYLSGWTVGVQEIALNLQGQYLRSRTASAIDQHYRPLASTAPPMLSHLRTGRPGLDPASELRHIHAKPNSLSYTHPYLLVSHPDNTLTLYLVFSDVDTLSISTGSRLWGHTSSVSGAHVGGRGKAVSVSRRGDELRIWELEGGFTSDAARKRLVSGELSVRVKAGPQNGLELVSADDQAEHADELTITRGWIGFDAENVAVLREESNGKQALVVYDFT